ncbi:MAG: ribonuclease HII [Candidatus Thermoplasmatota archaeon]|nr:ribonuclease HII [Candidatus Thermoplasmatota archaeon]
MHDGTETFDDLACGVDEAGRGPVIGPMVIAIVCGSNSAMKAAGARDSKILSPSSRERLYSEIERIANEISYRIITPDELNKRMENETLNEIEEDAYVSLILHANTSTKVYVDSFDVLPERLEQKLSSMTNRVVVCRHRADSIFPVVSAASIIAKVVRDREILKLSEKYGDIGSGYPSDPRTIRFLTESLRNGTDISVIVRTHWSTYRRIMAEVRSGRLF